MGRRRSRWGDIYNMRILAVLMGGLLTERLAELV